MEMVNPIYLSYETSKKHWIITDLHWKKLLKPIELLTFKFS